jgi:hypothetical protein
MGGSYVIGDIARPLRHVPAGLRIVFGGCRGWAFGRGGAGRGSGVAAQTVFVTAHACAVAAQTVFVTAHACAVAAHASGAALVFDSDVQSLRPGGAGPRFCPR